MVYQLKKAYRIKKNEEFQEIFKNGKSFANRQLVIYYKYRSNQEHFRVGLSVGKKIGNAVTRNRIKRYLRECFIHLEDEILPNIDMIIIARQPASQMDYRAFKSSLLHLLSRQRLLKNKRSK